MKRTVREFLQQRGVVPPTILDAETTVDQACQAMARNGNGAVLVAVEGKVRGIFTERDLLGLFADRPEGDFARLKLKEAMSQSLLGVTLDYSLEECLLLMAKMKVRHLPVLQGELTVHLLNLPEMAACLVEDKDFLIRELVNYISGPHPAPNGDVTPKPQRLESWNP